MDMRTTENPHRPYLLECAGAETAVLMVHGFLGSPVQFKPLARILHEQGYTARAILLPGHGGSAKEFAQEGRDAWMRAVEQTAAELRQKYKRIIFIGHSLGGLLSLNEAMQSGADGIVLISVPMRLRNNYHVLPQSIRMFWGDPEKDDDLMRFERSVFSIALKPIRHHLSSWPRGMDLLRLMRGTRKSLSRVQAPVLIIQSKSDQTVAWKSAGILERGLIHCRPEVMMLERSGHSYFHPTEAGPMYERICEFIRTAISQRSHY